MRAFSLTVAAAITSVALLPAQQATLRSEVASISIDVAVKRGNVPVANLSAADFRLSDQGVPQTIESFAIEDLPIDITLFLDTSGSTSRRLPEMKNDVRSIVEMLRPDDRFRLLTIGDSVFESVPWVRAGSGVTLSYTAVSGTSLIYDALAAALMYRPAVGRRHLVVALTDRYDVNSVVPSGLLLDMSSRSEAVVHLIDQIGGGQVVGRNRAVLSTALTIGRDNLRRVAETTGGEVHDSWRGSANVLKAFTQIFSDFRQSYVLRYTPRGTGAGGWHDVSVSVPAQKGATIHARQGYWAK